MNIDGAAERRKCIKKIWEDNRWLYIVLGFLLGALISPFLGYINRDLPNFLESLVPEAFGIVVTVGIIDSYLRRSEAKRTKHDQQERMIREASSQANPIALQAINELRHFGLLEGENGLLKDKFLAQANLENAYLANANLIKVGLWYAKLTKANFYMANLKESVLWRAELGSAILSWANLEKAILVGADLRGANLKGANLQGVRFWGFTQKGKNLDFPENFSEQMAKQSIDEDSKGHFAHFDSKTVLPDGTHWSSETDMRRFTWSEHRYFYPPTLDDQGKLPWWAELDKAD